MIPLLFRSSMRYHIRHAWQLALAVIGIAIGVAAVVAVDIANVSAREAFSVSAGAVAGNATHQIIGGPSGVPEDVYTRLRTVDGVTKSSPVVEGDVAVPARPGTVLHVLGIDLFSINGFYSYLSGWQELTATKLASFMSEPGTAIISSDLANRLDLRAGDTIEIDAAGKRQWIRVVGLMTPGDTLTRNATESLVVVDIATAQELLDFAGKLSRIDLISPGGSEEAGFLAGITATLPEATQVVSAGNGAAVKLQMTEAFSLNLTALSLLALIVGAFLIYNTMAFSVVQRRSLVGLLRATGVARRQLFAMILGEALLLGIVSTILGLIAGLFLAKGLVALVSQTINDLYFVVQVNRLTIEFATVAKALGLGVLATMIAAALPAIEATQVATRAALSRSDLEMKWRNILPVLGLVGIVLMAGGTAGLVWSGTNITASFVALSAVVFGFALATPAAAAVIARVASPILSLAFGITGKMAARGVRASLSRTGVAVAALVVAVSVTIGVGVMVDSFRDTVNGWLMTSLHADLYLSPPRLISNRADAALDPLVVETTKAEPGIARVNTYRRTRVVSDGSTIDVIALGIEAKDLEAYQLKEGSYDEAWPVFDTGRGVILSEPLAFHSGKRVGSLFPLRTDHGMVELPVVAVYYDYGTDQGVLMMSRGTYEGLFDDRAFSSLGIYASPGADTTALAASLRTRLSGIQDVVVRSNTEVRAASLEVFDRTFAITDVLRIVAIIVAFVGMLSALMALQLERSREIGVLRAIGWQPRQVWGLVCIETGLSGLAAGILAIPLGMILSTILIYVINLRSFGWTLMMRVEPSLLAQAVALSIAAALIAGMYPAWRMARAVPSVVIREE